MKIVHQHADIIAERYKVIDILGQGGSGTTYAVQHLETNESFALKCLSLSWINDWKVVELFEREAKTLSLLNHPAIPRYHEYFYIDTPNNRSFYIAQQQAPGKSLAMMVEQGWRTSELEVQDIAIQVLEILKYLHSLTPPVVHRDIKPHNIIRSDDGKIYLVDFGAVQQTYHDTFMRGSTVVGTYGYMAPEQFRSMAVPQSDLYGLAATLLYLLTHRSPADLPSDGLKIDVQNCVKVSEHFAAWLDKMLEPDLEERFTSAAEAMDVLISKRKIKTKKTATIPKTKFKLSIAITSVLAASFSIFLLNYYQIEILSLLGFKNFLNKVTLSQAMENADEELLIKLFKNGVDVNAKNTIGQTYLHTQRNEDVVKILIDKGADINARDEYNKTPLHTQQNENVVKIMIEKGANINARDEYNKTPLHTQSNENILNILIDKGADINAKDNNNQTLLHKAFNETIGARLINKGADMNARDIDGQTPLHTQRNDVIAKLLIQNGADVNAKAKNNQTPLHMQYDISVAKLLIKKGADVNARDKDGNTPILQAARSSSIELIKELLANGAKINDKDSNGNSILHIIVSMENGSEKEVQELLGAGANINAKNDNGDTPLHVSVNEYMSEFLIKNGADIRAKNNRNLNYIENRQRKQAENY